MLHHRLVNPDVTVVCQLKNLKMLMLVDILGANCHNALVKAQIRREHFSMFYIHRLVLNLTSLFFTNAQS